MFVKNQVLAVTDSGIKTRKTPVQASSHVVASMDGMTGGIGGTNVSTFYNSQSNFFMSGLLPATPEITEPSTILQYMYRDIYNIDNVGGSCIDIQSTFPFSDWELRGLEDKELDIFNRALDRLNLRDLLPQISVSYLTDGYYAGSLIFDPAPKNFMDILTHDALQCNITPSPFNNIDPKIRVTVSGAASQFINSASDYTTKYLATMPASFIDLLKEGAFVLDPVTTLYLARRGLSDRAFQSYLHRLLPMYLIEKTMFRGTLVEAQRRQRAMTHLTAGDDIWTPTSEELNMLVQRFQDAERDPLGGWISTRNAVQAQDLRPGGDFWKWTDMADVMTASKLRALGISEALLSGDACLVGSTEIKQANGSTKTIADMCPVPEVDPTTLEVGKWYDLKTQLPNRISDSAETQAWAFNGIKETFTVETEDGHSITGTANHPFWVMASDGTCSWKRLDHLAEGDLVAVED